VILHEAALDGRHAYPYLLKVGRVGRPSRWGDRVRFGSSRLHPVSLLLFAAASALGLGNLLTATLPPRPQPANSRRDAARSGDDAGFSITLTSPTSPYLLGRQTISIDPRIPPGDSIDQVDIFVDGMVVFTDRQPPYVYETDFGDSIRRHVILATAVTHQGRRARVSYISRLGDLTDDQAHPIEIVPALVRDAGGHAVRDLTVSDFTLLDNGARQRVVHLDSSPAPASIAVAIDAPKQAEASRRALLAGAVALSETLAPYQALAFIAPPAGSSAAGTTPARVVPTKSAASQSAATGPAPSDVGFSFAREPFHDRLGQAATEPGSTGSLGDLLTAAASALRARVDQRVLVLMLSGTTLPAAARPEGRTKGSAATAPPSSPSPEAALAAGLDALKRARATIYVVALGEPPRDTPGDGPAEPASPAGADGEAGSESAGAPSTAEPEAKSIETLLRSAAENSGGDFFLAVTPAVVEQACRVIAERLQQRYLIGYLPEGTPRPGWRTIEIRLRRPDLEVQSRRYAIAE
jgi:VWFA-related protein